MTSDKMKVVQDT